VADWDWVTISALATALGTLVLALATFASVRSANRAARVAEQSLLTTLRPLLMPSRPEDPPVKVGFADEQRFRLAGGTAGAEVGRDAVYLAMSLRNVGSGIAILHGWHFDPERHVGEGDHAPLEEFRRLSRDIYVPAGDTGFWQGAFRDPREPEYAAARDAVANRRPMTVDILYGDQEGGQRVISRFSLLPHDTEVWVSAVSRHWNVDRGDPR
jgi:hypothetical protein